MSIEETIQKRDSVYGSFAVNAEIAQGLKDVISQPFTSYDKLSAVQKEVLDLIFTKIGRIMAGNPNYKDHWHDIAGYATLAEQALNKK